MDCNWCSLALHKCSLSLNGGNNQQPMGIDETFQLHESSPGGITRTFSWTNVRMDCPWFSLVLLWFSLFFIGGRQLATNGYWWNLSASLIFARRHNENFFIMTLFAARPRTFPATNAESVWNSSCYATYWGLMKLKGVITKRNGCSRMGRGRSSWG